MQPKKPPVVRSLTALQVQRRIQRGERIRIIDVRDPNEYTAGHIPGAELIPMDHIPTAIYQLKVDEDVLFVCRSGSRSLRVCEYLSAKGFTRVINLKGGMMQWSGRVERDAAQ